MEEQHEKHKPYNLVLMDWNMPGMNGLEASAEIRKQFQNESTVVVLTAYNWDDIREKAERVGVNSCLAKPLSVSGLTEEITRIARRGGAPQLRETKRANLEGRRILLAEDLESNAEIMTDILEMENIRTDHAANGRIAVEMFAGSEPGTYAAILMDVRMPEMDGLEATAAIRALKRADANRSDRKRLRRGRPALPAGRYERPPVQAGRVGPHDPGAGRTGVQGGRSIDNIQTVFTYHS